MNSTGVVDIDKVSYKVDVDHASGQVLVVSDGDQPGDTVIVTDLDDEIVAEPTSVTEVLMQNCYSWPETPRGVNQQVDALISNICSSTIKA